MILLHSFIHRFKLAEILGRWLVHDLRPEDGPHLKEILNFNGLITRNYIEDFTRRLLTGVHGHEPRSMKIRTKGELKNFIAGHTPITMPRCADLIRNYHSAPDLYYLETPYDGTTYWLDNGERPLYIGSNRVKSIRRIGEKGSRRVIDYIFEQIKDRAGRLAEERARRLGIPLHSLITPEEDMNLEFLRAEALVKDGIRRGFLFTPGTYFHIHDVAGIKVAGKPGFLKNVVSWLENDPRSKLLEVEEHMGSYNATNLLIQYTFDQEPFLNVTFGDGLRSTLAGRGIDPIGLEKRFRSFITEGEKTVNLEVILSTYDEMLESELGRCMHEERVIRQRSRQEYRSSLASNVSRMVEWVFAFALSSQQQVDEIPIKLWISYMPEYYDMVFRTLYKVPFSTAFST